MDPGVRALLACPLCGGPLGGPVVVTSAVDDGPSYGNPQYQLKPGMTPWVPFAEEGKGDREEGTEKKRKAMEEGAPARGSGNRGGDSTEPTTRLVCRACDRWFPVFSGIPFLLPSHGDNLLGEGLSSQYTNEPGVSRKPSQRFRWYYDPPVVASGVEEGEWVDFSHREMRGRVLDIGAGDRDCLDVVGDTSLFVTMDINPRDHPTVVADAHHLPFRSGSFDSVIARALIEHVERPERVVAEVSRVLRPGGLFTFSAPFIYPIHDAVDYHRFTIYSIRAMARQNNFRIMRITSGGGFFGVLAKYVHHGLWMMREYIDRKYEHRPLSRRAIRVCTDLAGMIIYLPFYLLRLLDTRYRAMAKREQGRIPFVSGYNAVFKKGTPPGTDPE